MNSRIIQCKTKHDKRVLHGRGRGSGMRSGRREKWEKGEVGEGRRGVARKEKIKLRRACATVRVARVGVFSIHLSSVWHLLNFAV